MVKINIDDSAAYVGIKDDKETAYIVLYGEDNVEGFYNDVFELRLGRGLLKKIVDAYLNKMLGLDLDKVRAIAKLDAWFEIQKGKTRT